MCADRIDAMVSSYSSQLKWLDCLFLQKCLQRISEDKLINVISFNVTPATKMGENFASDIFRVNVQFTESKSNDINGVSSVNSETRNTLKTMVYIKFAYVFFYIHRQNGKAIICDFIIKMALNGETALDALNELNVYEKEMEMYEKILPQLKMLLQKVGTKRKIFADTIFVSKTHKAMLMEDLVTKGYRSTSIKDGYVMAHAKAILSRLAKFHGAAVVLQEQQPDIYKNFKHGNNSRAQWSSPPLQLNKN